MAPSAKHFATRHPRYTTLLAIILVGLIFVYAQGQPDEHYFKHNSIQSWIREEDRRYQQTLRERDAMIQKWGLRRIAYKRVFNLLRLVSDNSLTVCSAQVPTAG